MDRNDIGWAGAFCAVVTPFQKDGDLDEVAFKENIQLLLDEGISGLVVAGCTGEFWSMTESERLRTFELAKETAGDAATVIGHASAIRTSEAISYATGARERGLDGVMLTPPAYVLSSSSEILEHYRAVSSEGQLPILLYNIPRRVGSEIDGDLLEKLADVEYVVAYKQSSSRFQGVIEAIQRVGTKIRLLPGHSVEWGLASLAMGADGYVGSVEPQILGERAISLYRLFANGDLDAAQEVQFECIATDRLVHGGVGTFPSSLKAAMNVVGRPGGYPREPLQPVTEEQEQRLRAHLRPMTGV